jgi:type I restriction enzyme R subunit
MPSKETKWLEMPRGQKEAQARIKINKLLEQSGWRLIDDATGTANVQLEPGVTMSALGNDFENTRKGYIDYLLLDDNKKPLVVLEAKRENIPPLSAKEQARGYANANHARYVILSNGNSHYFWDMKFGNPEPVSVFPTLESLVADEKWSPDVDALVSEQVDKNYIALSQKPDFLQDPSYIHVATQDKYIRKNKLKILRGYQVKAIQAIQHSAQDNHSRFLLEMATGTGKTLTCAAIIKLFLRTGNARRVLFLVDRIELENQAKKAFDESIGQSYTVLVYKQARDNWNTADILVSTVQSLQSNDRYRDFSPTDFDLIISDEAHRSISGNARAVLEYFKGYKIGLTATPKDYMKNYTPTPGSVKDFEARELRDTYKTFGCESGQPTFRYSLNDGVNDPEGPFLVNPLLLDIRTEVTTQLLDDKGFAVHVVNDDDEEVDEIYGMKDFERSFFNEDTNRAMCNAFIARALKDPISGDIGKSIVFCVSQAHAAKITQLLNERAEEIWPGRYQSDFAIQITSQVKDAQNYTIQFSENTLRGKTNSLLDYDSCKTRVAVTVGMMTTGYDCPDLLNVVFMRPVFSPSDFIQMKGRGTRKHRFSWIDYDNGESNVAVDKKGFLIVDFFAVCEYFEEEYDYTEPLPSPTNPPLPCPVPGTGEPPVTAPRMGDQGIADNVATVEKTNVGAEGMRVDREMFKNWQESVQNNKELQELYRNDERAAADYFKHEILNKPEMYMTLEKLRQYFNLDRNPDVQEWLDIVLNDKKPKTRDEKIKEYFDDFILTSDLSNVLVGEDYNKAYELFDAYITNDTVRNAINQGQYSDLEGAGSISIANVTELNKKHIFTPVINYVRDYVNIDRLKIWKKAA